MKVYSYFPERKPTKKPFYEREWFKNLVCFGLLMAMVVITVVTTLIVKDFIV